jgi:PhnB protein
MLGGPGEGYRSPKDLGGTTHCVYVYVDDVDAHFERAKSSGAEIIRDVEDQFYGDRSYGAKDPEGHEWFFATRVRDVSPEEMKAAMAGAQAG